MRTTAASEDGLTRVERQQARRDAAARDCVRWLLDGDVPKAAAAAARSDMHGRAAEWLLAEAAAASVRGSV